MQTVILLNRPYSSSSSTTKTTLFYARIPSAKFVPQQGILVARFIRVFWLICTFINQKKGAVDATHYIPYEPGSLHQVLPEPIS